MNKHRAAPAGDPGPSVVIDFDEDIVETILTPKPIAWFNGRPTHRAVIIAVRGVFAPSIGGADPPRRQQSLRTRQAIRPPPQPQREESPARRPPIALAFIRLDAAAADRNRYNEGTGPQDALPMAARPDTHPDAAQVTTLQGSWLASAGGFPTRACSCILCCSTSRPAARQKRHRAVDDQSGGRNSDRQASAAGPD